MEIFVCDCEADCYLVGLSDTTWTVDCVADNRFLELGGCHRPVPSGDSFFLLPLINSFALSSITSASLSLVKEVLTMSN